MNDAAKVPRFAELFAALPVATLVLDPDGRITHANGAAEHVLGFSERALIGKPLASVIVPPSGYAARREGHGFAAYDVDMERMRGARLRGDFVETLVVDHDGWRIVTLHEAPQSRRLGHGPERSAGARAAIGAAAMLAHEIKNPLSGIRGAAQLIASGIDDVEPLTTLITTEVDRIAALIDRMEDFTHDRPLRLSPANIYPLLGHVRRLADAGFARGATIVERYDPSLPPVMVDADAFQQIMLNLLKNAAEAIETTNDPKIVIATAYRHGMAASPAPGQPRRPLPIEIAVIDNGPGAPDDIVEHLFEPFVTGKREGRGLGLPLVEKLVGDMGGIVQYDREGDPPHTIFRILLPRAVQGTTPQ
jgi:two-component system, NtrC family, nitrogen regulation sensor histidine kinase GlnL